MADVGLANAQQTARSDAALLGEGVGTALGVRDGAAQGANDDISGLTYSPPSYLQPTAEDICTVYQDFYDTYCQPNSQQYIDYFYAYQSGYEYGYISGYTAGYYLDETLGSLYQPIR
jgi:hypothetical protein